MKDYKEALQEGKPSVLQKAIDEHNARLNVKRLAYATIERGNFDSSLADEYETIAACQKRIAAIRKCIDHKDESLRAIAADIRELESAVTAMQSQVVPKKGSEAEVLRLLDEADIDERTLQDWIVALQGQIEEGIDDD